MKEVNRMRRTCNWPSSSGWTTSECPLLPLPSGVWGVCGTPRWATPRWPQTASWWTAGASLLSASASSSHFTTIQGVKCRNWILEKLGAKLGKAINIGKPEPNGRWRSRRRIEKYWKTNYLLYCHLAIFRLYLATFLTSHSYDFEVIAHAGARLGVEWLC